MSGPREPSAVSKVNYKSDEKCLSSTGILEEIGEFGLYQIIIGISIGAAMILTSCAMFDFVFASAIPEHRLARAV